MFRTSMPRQAQQTTVLPSPRRRFRLRVRLRSGTKRTIKLRDAKYAIGDSPLCQIQVPAQSEETGVHCLLLQSRGRLIARSWSPECRLNGRPFEVAELLRGDKLQVPGAILSLLDGRRRKKNSDKILARTGKRLVGEIGKRLARLEERLVRRQLRLTRQLEAAAQTLNPSIASIPSEATPAPAAESAPSPIVLAGLDTLRSAVEELRGRVEEVMEHTRTASETTPEAAPAIDAESLLDAASNRLRETVESSLREERTRTALRYEEFSRDFARIGDRLNEVEQKLHSPLAAISGDSIQPVSEAVEFVRAGLQAIESRQSQGAERLELLASGLEGLRQSTEAQLASITEKVSVIPSLHQVEEALASVSNRVEEIAKEIAERDQQVFTRDDAAPLFAQLEAATAARTELENRLVDLGQQVTDLGGVWNAFQSETENKLQLLAERIDSLPTGGGDGSSASPVDLSPLNDSLAALEAKLAAQQATIDEQTDARNAIEAKLEAAQLALQELREGGVAAADQSGQFAELTEAISQVRSVAEGAAEEARTAQADLLRQLMALEDRCLFLESELARLSRLEPRVESTASAETSSIPEPIAPAIEEEPAPTGLIASAFYSNPEDSATNNPALSGYQGYQGLSTLDRIESEPENAEPIQNEPASAQYTPELPVESQPEDTRIDTVVDQLRKSGIWKDDAPAPEPSEESEDPRDVVGASFHSDPTPPTGIDPGKSPAEQLEPTWNTPASDEGEEESIDAYMQRLMQRVSGNATEVNGAMAVAEHLQQMKKREAGKRAAQAAGDSGPFEYAPRVAPPEKNADLSALRELAVTSAHVNIQNYHAATTSKKANEKWLVVTVAMICATGLLFICLNYRNNWNYLAAVASFTVALYWAIQATLTTAAAKRISNSPVAHGAAPPEEEGERESSVAKNASRAAARLMELTAPNSEPQATPPAEEGREEEPPAEAPQSQLSGDAEFYRTLNQLMPEQQPPSE